MALNVSFLERQPDNHVVRHRPPRSQQYLHKASRSRHLFPCCNCNSPPIHRGGMSRKSCKALGTEQPTDQDDEFVVPYPIMCEPRAFVWSAAFSSSNSSLSPAVYLISDSRNAVQAVQRDLSNHVLTLHLSHHQPPILSLIHALALPMDRIPLIFRHIISKPKTKWILPLYIQKPFDACFKSFVFKVPYSCFISCCNQMTDLCCSGPLPRDAGCTATPTSPTRHCCPLASDNSGDSVLCPIHKIQ
jgi:hypothetical protein